MEERMDRLVNIDFGGRGIEGLYEAAREKIGKPLVLAAAEKLAAVPPGSVVLMTTGSVSRAWISARICENDGPAGAAVVARALTLGLDAIPVVYAEEALLGVIGDIYRAAGMSLVSLEEARRTSMPGGKLAVAVMRSYPLDDEQGRAQAGRVLDEIRPALVFSTERVGRNVNDIYHNARGVDFGMGRARIDYVFDEALRRGIPSVAVGDGGNEIGMGLIPEAIARHVQFGDTCNCGCGAGLGAVTSTDVLVTAACSNWGCYAITASLATLLGKPELLHTPDLEEVLLRRGVEIGLINSSQGRVDPNVDGIPLECHKAITALLRELALRKK
jgi:D-glutamate cyclase